MKKIIYKASRAGFTLIELLIVVAMMGAIGLALYGTLSSGIKIWQKSLETSPKEDLGIFFDKLSSDIRNSVKVTGMAFTGNQEGFKCPTIVNSAKLNARTVGEVKYKYESAAGKIRRHVLDYSDLYSVNDGTERYGIDGVKIAVFMYYIFDETKQEYLWVEGVSGEDPPFAVSVELEITKGGKTERYEKTVGIPIAN